MLDYKHCKRFETFPQRVHVTMDNKWCMFEAPLQVFSSHYEQVEIVVHIFQMIRPETVMPVKRF